MDDTTHELLLHLAGRVDDDLLADARELVAVGEDGHALELVTAALAADGTALPPAVRAELVTAATIARIDLDADAALAPAGPDTAAHRFSASAAADVPVIAAVRELPDRLRDGIRMRLAWRQTPAGPAPTPLPYPVLLVESAADGRPGEVLAYQMRAAMARSDVHVAVEVLTSGKPLTGYHAAALRNSTPLSPDAPPRQASPQEKVESVVAEVVEEVTASHRVAAPEERPVDLFALDDDPAPRPVPLQAWQSGRRRRGFDEQAAEVVPDEDITEATDHGPLPSPVPLARRTRPRAAAAGDPLAGPLNQPLVDPLLDPDPATEEGTWTDEWASGDWALAEDAVAAGPPSTGGSPTLHAVAGHHETATGPHGSPSNPRHSAGLDGDATGAAGHSGAPGPHAPAAPRDAEEPHGTAVAPATAGSPQNAVPRHTGPEDADAGNSAPPTQAPAPPNAAPLDTGPPNAVLHAPLADPHSAAPQAITPHASTGGAHALFSEPDGVGPHPVEAPGTAAGRPETAPADLAAAGAPDEPRSSGGPAHALADPPTDPVAEPSTAEALLRPEALARLSDEDRELLTRLQAELAGGAGTPLPGGANGSNGATNGSASG